MKRCVRGGTRCGWPIGWISPRGFEAAGKEVVSVDPGVDRIERGFDDAAQDYRQRRFAVEANDMGAVHCLKSAAVRGRPHLNIYNSPTLDLLAKHGAKRWVMPLEMGKDGLALMQRIARPRWRPKYSPMAACRWLLVALLYRAPPQFAQG